MANVLTPAAAYDTADAITAPEDGDDLDAAVIETDLQVLADRARYAHVALQNHIVWDGVFAVRPGGTLTSFTLDIGGIYLAALAAGTVSQVEQAVAATTITQTAIEGGGGTLGAQARWWYVYAFEGSGLEYEISLTAPGVGRRTKLGSATRVYLGCFPTDSTGAPMPVTRVGNRVVYRRGGIASVEAALGSNGLRAVDGATAVARTVLDLSSRVPPHSRVALLYGQVLAVASGSSGVGALNLYTAADTTSIALVIETQAEGSGAKGVNGSHAEVELTSAQLCAYSVTQSSAAAVGDLDVLGWLE